MRARRGRGLVSFCEVPRAPNAAFEGLEVDVGFGGGFRRFPEGSGGVSGGFSEATSAPKSHFGAFFRDTFRERVSGANFRRFREGPNPKNRNFL